LYRPWGWDTRGEAAATARSKAQCGLAQAGQTVQDGVRCVSKGLSGVEGLGTAGRGKLGGYILDRDSLGIRWGLRDEDIPPTDIDWLCPTSDLITPLRLLWLPIPGAVLGLRHHPDLGVVEFLAASPRNLLLVGTSKRVYAISPTNAAKFAQTFARTIEMGSLTPSGSQVGLPILSIFARLGKPADAFSVAGRVVFDHRIGDLGHADHPHAEPGDTWLRAVRRNMISLTGIAVDLAAYRECVSVPDRAVCRAIFLPLANASCVGCDHLDLRHLDQFVVFIGSIRYYCDAGLPLTPGPSP
jgi:hypothetical protein